MPNSPTPEPTPAIPLSESDAPAQPSRWLADARVFTAAILTRCRDDRGARAALRTGVRKPLDSQRMHRIVSPLLPADALRGEDAQRAHYAVAALIAEQGSKAHPSASPATEQDPPSPYGESLGLTFATAVNRGATGGARGIRHASAEMRLNLLVKQSLGGLHRHLPATVRQLCDTQCPPDWAQLLVDLRGWHLHRRRTGRRWLQDFYRSRHQHDHHQARLAAEAEDAELQPTS